MKKIIAVTLLLVNTSFLSGCSTEIVKSKVSQYRKRAQEIAQDAMARAGDYLSKKFQKLMARVETRAERVVDEAIAGLKKQVSSAAKKKIDEWLDQNLSLEKQEKLTVDELQKLIDANPELLEILKNS